MTDKKLINTVSASVLAALLIIFLVPFENVGRVIAAFVTVAAATVCIFLLKKRCNLSMYKNQVFWLVLVSAVLYLIIYFLMGLFFGFAKNPYGLNFTVLFIRPIPIIAVIVSSEIVRYTIRAYDNKAADIFCYFALVVAELIICSTISVALSSFNKFMDLVGLTLFPALVSNGLYHYLTKRYGFLPNIAFRLITALYPYVFKVLPRIPDALLACLNFLIPLAIYFFIDLLYEKKKSYALKKKSPFGIILSVACAVIMLFSVAVVSNRFSVGTFVIATESMTGELNKGDAALYRKYEDQTIKEGQVIAFEKNNSVVIHRVVDIERVNGVNFYYTKGDANESNDVGYVLDSDIIGIVDFKIPYVGYPTIWIRSLFSR